MILIVYAPSFIKKYKKLPPLLKIEVKEKIGLFKNPDNHTQLRVHKLKNIENTYSFSVNYKIRVVFEFDMTKNKKTVPTTANLLSVGGHDEVY